MGWGGEGVSEKTVCSGLAFWDRKEFFFPGAVGNPREADVISVSSCL